MYNFYLISNYCYRLNALKNQVYEISFKNAELKIFAWQLSIDYSDAYWKIINVTNELKILTSRKLAY